MPHKVVTMQVNSPAAGADWSFVPSNTDKTLLLAVTAKLTTDATVANRRAAIALEDYNGLIYYSADALYPQAASIAVTYSWARGGGAGVATTVVATERASFPLPWLRLQPGDKVASITGAIDTSDQWTSIIWRGIVGDWWEQEQELAHVAEALAIAAAG